MLELGRLEEAVAVWDPGPALEQGAIWARLMDGFHHAAGGRPEAARAAIDDDIRAWAETDAQYCWHLGQVFALTGDHDEAVEWLDRAVDAQLLNWRMLGEHDRILEPLHGRDDFRDVVERARREHERLAMRWGVPPL